LSTVLKDLIVLVADKDMAFTIRALLARWQAFRIRQLAFDVQIHPQHDAGVRSQCDTYLRPFQQQYHFALVLFDRSGSGAEDRTAEEIETEAEARIGQAGWSGRSGVIVLDPELEAWVWSASTRVDEVPGWSSRVPDLRSWLVDQKYCIDKGDKPARPKEAMESAMRKSGVRWSSAVFKSLAESVSVQGCSDRAFQKFRNIIQTRFPQE
jgi:hypothetical protein